MVHEIKMNAVASYKQPAVITGLKRVNLFYGLNGTGKSTISQFLASHGQEDARFTNCSITFRPNTTIPEILVYNEDFIRENFLMTNTQKGIFTLDKANKDAEIAISNAKKDSAELEKQKFAPQDLMKKHSVLKS